MYFFKAQGYQIDYNVLHQDNYSTNCMYKNRRNSYAVNLRHVKIIFFIKDQVYKREISVKISKTEHMIVDYSTKLI